jgi:hypothetical protein
MRRPRDADDDPVLGLIKAGGDAASTDDWEAKADAVQKLIDAAAVTRNPDGTYTIPE